MLVHGKVVFFEIAEKRYLFGDLAQNVYARFHKPCYLFFIETAISYALLYPGKRNVVKLLIAHSL